MAADLPYLPTYKNVEELFKRIASAKQPDAFTTRFLTETIGLKGTGDRALITLLKTLGFLDQGGRPTEEYGALKNPSEAPRAIGRATKRAFAPLFAANENAHTLPAQDLRGLIAQVAGSDGGLTSKISGTFNALAKLSEFRTADTNGEAAKDDSDEAPAQPLHEERKAFGVLRPEFHYNIQVHLPANSSEETYLNIFNALRKAFS
jgi:hypothetical protein